LWTAGGTNLGSVVFANETASGWQQALFTTPIGVTANTTYVISYHTNVGFYADTQNGVAAAIDNAPLHALADAGTGNGVYGYGANTTFPNSTWQASNYWVDSDLHHQRRFDRADGLDDGAGQTAPRSRARVLSCRPPPPTTSRWWACSFKLDGVNLVAEDTTTPYTLTWDSTTASNGSHTLTAVARDAAGNAATATGVTVTVSNDSTPPTVSMTAPAGGANVSGSNITVFRDGRRQHRGGWRAVQAGWRQPGCGRHRDAVYADLGFDVGDQRQPHADAVARDAAGNSSTSTGVAVTVSNDPTPPTVSMTAPAGGANVSGSSITVSATATDNIAVVGVQFKIDGATSVLKTRHPHTR